MLRTKQTRVFFVLLVIFSLVAVYGFIPSLLFTPFVKAATLESAKDVISDSGFNASSSHTVIFDMSQDLDPDDVIRLTFHDDFANFANVSAVCPANSTASTTSSAEGTFQVVECVATGVISGAAVATTTVYNLTNPGTDGERDVTITILDEGVTELESTQMFVYIIQSITVSATVDSTLEFSLTALGPDSGTTNVNGIDITATSTQSAIAFGTINNTASSTMGHSLSVSTNASDGFTVTVEQNNDLQTAAGATINAFNNSPDGSGSSTAADMSTWVKPLGVVGANNTYGHIGLTSDDATLSWGGGDPFGTAKYAGLNGSDLMEVMYNSGPADGSTAGSGLANVAYTIEITSMQEAGDYTNTLTYICTPTY